MDTFISNSPEETFGLGRRWAAELRPGWVVGLIGDRFPTRQEAGRLKIALFGGPMAPESHRAGFSEAEAILALSWQRPVLGDALWQDTLDELRRVRETLGVAAPELDALLAGDELPCKTNFTLRLMAKADREAQYVALPNPWYPSQVMSREVAYG